MLWTADFMDGSRWEQPRDDQSILFPGKTSKADYLEFARGRELAALHLYDGAHDVLVDCRAKRLLVNGQAVTRGAALPEGCRWIDEDTAQGPYFRRVTMEFDPSDLQHPKTLTEFCIGQPGSGAFVAVR